MTPLTIGSLFSGIGGLDLGLERGIGNGARTIWQVEQNAYCRAVLAKHWPDATRYEDVRNVGRANLASVDIICGGFPCQDISHAKQDARGLSGERSGLWFEYARIIGELRPSYVVVENVSALLVRGIDGVLGSLAELRYDAEWTVLSAADVGAPHLRDRVWIVAYPANGALEVPRVLRTQGATRQPRGSSWRPVAGTSWATHQPGMVGVVRRVPRGLDSVRARVSALGNCVVPDMAEVVGRLIAERESLAVAA